MTFQSVKVYLLEISAPLLVHSNKTEETRLRVYSLILDQQRALCKDTVPPDWGHGRIPSVILCIIASPLPLCIIQVHPPYSSKISSRYCLLMSEQTKTRFGG